MSRGDAWDSESGIRRPPQSVEAEQAVLGGLMLDPAAWDQVADQLIDEDFIRHDHRLIFNAAAALVERGQPCDVVTLAGQLGAQGHLADIGGLAYLGSLARDTPSAVNIQAYARIVRERSVLRQLVTAANHIATMALEPEGRDAHDVVDAAERAVFEISERGARGKAGFKSMKTILPPVIERLDELYHSDAALTGLATGFTDLDQQTAGLQPGDLIIIAGRPSMGKTTLAVNIAEHAALKAQKSVAIFSMEMSSESLALRMLSSIGRINQSALRSGRLQEADWPRVAETMTRLTESRLFVDDTPALTPMELRARARRLQRERGGLDLIVVDYLQLMTGSGVSTRENRATVISEITRSLKALAKELAVPVIALSQLNRGVEQRTEKKPVMSDLRECVVGDTTVWLADGRRIPIRELEGSTREVFALTADEQIVTATTACIWSQGIRPVCWVKLASGRSLTVTPAHRFYSDRGWLPIASLNVGDHLRVLTSLADPDETGPLFWDRIEQILFCGTAEVFDLSVPGPENWFSDGVVSHNSGAIEQDADVILLIYREDQYDKNTTRKGLADIIIAKQRNGPTGDIQLTFLGQYTKFDNYEAETLIEGSLR